MAETIDPECEVVLLGSIATGKYLDLLAGPFGERLRFPSEFVGRGDMSRGGLLLRCVRAGAELTYVPVLGAIRTGTRPPKLAASSPGCAASWWTSAAGRATSASSAPARRRAN